MDFGKSGDLLSSLDATEAFPLLSSLTEHQCAEKEVEGAEGAT
jgi:hypothetical protein